MEDGRYKPMSMQIDGMAGSGKPPPPQILERFRAMVRESEDELIRVSENEENDLVLSFDEIVRLYDIVLSELTLNSKPIITELTIIAGEHREHGAGIADAICARIVEVPVDQKLPTLYLLDSIVKNIGKEYIKYFSARLPEVFCHTYNEVHPNMRPAMRHLFGTWRTVFQPLVLHKIESHLQFTPVANHQSSSAPHLRTAESPRPAHGIHVNPKYLEARRQFGHSTADANIQAPRGTSTTSRTYGQKPSIEYDEFNSDDAEVNALHAKTTRLSSSVHAVPTSIDTLKLPPSSRVRVRRSSSPYSAGNVRSSSPSLEVFGIEASPTTVAERASPSDPQYDYCTSRVTGTGEGTVDWKRNFPSGDIEQVKHSTAFRYNNEVDLQRPRALIDAYGIDEREDVLNHKHRKVEQMDVNGVDRNGAARTWQNAPEEEFDWEDMSPTLADHGRHKDVFSSSLPSSGSFRRSSLGTHDAALLAPDLHHDWSNRAQLSVVNGSSMVEDVHSIRSSDGVNNMSSGIHNEIQGSRYNQESWKLVQNLDGSSRQHFDAPKSGRNIQMPFSGSGAPLGSFLEADSQNRVPPFASRTRSPSFDYSTPVIQLATTPASTGAWPPPSLHNSHARPLLPLQPNRPMRGQLDTWDGSNLVTNQDVERSTYSSQQSGPISLNQHSLGKTIVLPQQSLLFQDVRQNMLHPPVSVPYPSLAPQMNRGYAPRAHMTSSGTNFRNSVPMGQSSMPILSVPNPSMHPGMPFPYLPRGPHPGASQMHHHLQNPTPLASNLPGGGDYSNLFNSLMAHGVISLSDQAPGQDSGGVGFDPDRLKVRHEFAITALYADLSRQCTTCGLRFKCQEAHRSHMDWHVTRNRISKNRKQKPSRKWFVSVNMWLTGSEGVKTDAVPGFQPTENVVEEKDEEELAVPADDDQKECALCGEPFEDFYSDETEEWMYKGAVYTNAPAVMTPGMDRTQLGPIVHAKCRSETGVASSEDFRKSVVGL